MAKTCQFCQKPGVHGNHERFCNKNPKRVQGKPAPKSDTKTTNPVVSESAPIIEAKVDPVPVNQLPNFSSPDSSTSASSPANGKSWGQDTTQPPGMVPGIISSAEVVRPLVDVIFDHMHSRMLEVEGKAKAKGPPEPLSKQDRDALAAIYGLVVDKYCPPAILQRFGLEIAALLLTLTVVVPKVFEYRAYFKAKTEKKKPVESEIVNPQRVVASSHANVVDVGGDDWKEAYENAVKAGRIPA